MRTEDLVTLLATGIEPVAPHPIARRYAIALSVGLVGALVIMLTLLGLRPDLGESARLPMFWVKIAFAGSLAWAALAISRRLGTPGARLGWRPVILILPVVMIWGLAATALFSAPAADRAALVFGATWARCPWLIAILSIPPFLAAFWVMRDLAPTRPRLAGAASGLLAGALAAVVYSLHCPEMAAPFLSVWYLLGILIPAMAGAMLGPRLLPW